jgi:hypothetical protein
VAVASDGRAVVGEVGIGGGREIGENLMSYNANVVTDAMVGAKIDQWSGLRWSKIDDGQQSMQSR